jgi:hypothetical protein
MRYLPALILSALMMPAMAADDAIPRPFTGIWDLSPAVCKEDFSDGRVEITEDSITNVGARCELTRTTQTDPATYTGVFVCQSEGEEATETFALRVDGDRLSLTGELDDDALWRCD